MAKFYNRYKKVIANGRTIPIIPFIRIPDKNTDEQIIWKKGETRIDIISNKYYGTPYGGWLILLKNGFFDENEIPNNTFLIVPFPFEKTIQNYVDELNRYDTLYGIESSTL